MITLAIAGGTALLQILMKGSSRTNLPNKNHGLTADDTLFWTDWTIAAVLALSGSVIAAVSQGRQLAPNIGQLAFGYGAIVVGFLVFPFCLRTFAYGPGAQMKKIKPRGVGWFLISNAVGMLILLGAVVAGVHVYDW